MNLYMVRHGQTAASRDNRFSGSSDPPLTAVGEAMAEEFATRLAELTSADVRLIDERFSTTSASRALTGAGKSAKKQRPVIDQAAAVVILESALDVDRRGNLGIVTKRIPHEGKDD